MNLRKKLRIASLIMLIVAVLFVSFALWHPEMNAVDIIGVRISLEATWVFYKSYVAIMVGLFIVSFFVKKG